jgi:hypothetical protein
MFRSSTDGAGENRSAESISAFIRVSSIAGLRAGFFFLWQRPQFMDFSSLDKKLALTFFSQVCLPMPMR